MTQRKYDSFTILYFSRAFEVKNSFFSKVLYLDIQSICIDCILCAHGVAYMNLYMDEILVIFWGQDKVMFPRAERVLALNGWREQATQHMKLINSNSR